MLSYKCNISIALWSRAENAPLTINRKTNFLVLLRSWVWWMDSTPLFCLLYPRTRTKRVGNLDCKPINFSAKVRYNHVTETDRAREGAGAAAGTFNVRAVPAVHRAFRAVLEKWLECCIFWHGRNGQAERIVVRIHPRPPNKKNPNLFPIGEGFGFFVFFGYNNEGSRGRRKTPIPCHRP